MNKTSLLAAVSLLFLGCEKAPTGNGPEGPFTIRTAASHGHITLTPAGEEYDSGTVVTATAVPDYGFKFSGWSGDVSGSDTMATFTVVKNMTVNAAFIVDTTVPVLRRGSHWIKAQSGTQARLNMIIWTGKTLYVVGDSGTLLSSPDGIVWKKIPTGITNVLVDLVWTGTRLIAITLDGRILTSETGTTWTERSLNLTAQMNTVGWTGRMAVAVGRDGDFAYSTDGISWTPGHFHIFNFRPTAMVKGGDVLYCVGYQTVHPSNSNNYPAMVFGTRDGINWNDYSPGYDCNSMMAAVWTGENLLAVATFGQVFSSGGSIWASNFWDLDYIDKPYSLGDLYGITWTGEETLAVGEGGVIIVTKGKMIRYFERLWRPAEDVNFLAITWTGTRAVTIGSGGSIYYTP